MTDLSLSGNATIAIIRAVAFCFEMLDVVSESLGPYNRHICNVA